MITELSGFVSRVKSNGPKTEPWGTPHRVGSISEKQFSILMTCRLSVRYEEKQRNTLPDMQYQVNYEIVVVNGVICCKWIKQVQCANLDVVNVKANVVMHF